LKSIEYLFDCKTLLSTERAQKGWDLFISAYNDSKRVQEPFGQIRASNKVWWSLPEYKYSRSELPVVGEVVELQATTEADAIEAGFETSGFRAGTNQSICVDITGFMRPHILYFLKFLKSKGVRQCDMIYSEPERYARRAETVFSMEDVASVRAIQGFEGEHITNMEEDVLIVGIGYDHSLISRVILEKESARLIQLHCFPSLSADMYHESILRLDRTSTGKGRAHEHVLFSSANDPFVTASVLSEAYAGLKKMKVTNLYLSPLATKPHTLGFGLFYLRELESTPASMIFPFSTAYSRETGSGIGRTWLYPILF
jgi:hypothetical protein